MSTTMRWTAPFVVVSTMAACGGSHLAPAPPPTSEPAQDGAPSPPADPAASSDVARPGPSSSAVTPDERPAEAEPSGPGDDASPSPAEPASSGRDTPPAAPASPPASPAVDGVNVTIGSLDVDGVKVEDLSCRIVGGGVGGLFGTLAIAAGFGQRKVALDRCAPASDTRTTVRWTQRGGKITTVAATRADGKPNRCVEAALRGAAASQDAECAAIVVHGR